MTNKHLDLGDFESYGAEMSDLVNLTNQQTAEIRQLKGKVDDVGRSAIRVSEDIFYKELDRAVPDWNAVNKDANWREWLGQVDPLTGKIRQELLDAARDAFDVNRVVTFFKTFKGSGGVYSQSSSESEPERKASTITRAQYTKAVKDTQTGRMTEEEFNKIADRYQRQTTGAS